MALIWTLLFCLLGGILSVLLAAWVLLLSDSMRKKTLPAFLSFSVGALLAAALLAILPHAISDPHITDPHEIFQTLLAGLLLFFLLERLVIWRHCHTHNCDVHLSSTSLREASAARLILVGDGIHNFVDGIMIAAAFLTDTHLGVVTGLAVIAHELPQEMGDFLILLQGGFDRRKALIANLLISLTTVLGGLLAYFFLKDLEAYLPYVLALTASNFIYVAVADLIPGLHDRASNESGIQQVFFIAAGIGVIVTIHQLLH